MTELCLVLPNYTTKVYIPKRDRNLLRLQCTGYMFECDYDDWIKARNCLWWFDEKKMVPVNSVGITFTEYVGIKGSRLTEGVEKYNFCRNCYGN